MKAHVPRGDAVLAAWFKMLKDFKQDLPLLHKLSHEALKVRVKVKQGQELLSFH